MPSADGASGIYRKKSLKLAGNDLTYALINHQRWFTRPRSALDEKPHRVQIVATAAHSQDVTPRFRLPARLLLG